jgi:hypothetical protein
MYMYGRLQAEFLTDCRISDTDISLHICQYEYVFRDCICLAPIVVAVLQVIDCKKELEKPSPHGCLHDHGPHMSISM